MKIYERYEQFIDYLFKGRKIVLFGASSGGLDFLAENPDIEISAICDNNEELWNTTLVGVPVISFDELIKRKDETVVIIASEQGGGGIKKQLLDNGFGGNVFTKHEVNNGFRDKLYELLKQDSIGCVLSGVRDRLTKQSENEESIREARALYEDDHSKWLLDKWLLFRRCGYEDFSRLMSPGVQDLDFFNFSESEVYIDAGAAGGTVLDFVSTVKNRFKLIYAFEPNNKDYKMLKYNTFLVRALSHDKCHIVKEGVYDRNDVLNYYSRPYEYSGFISEQSEIGEDWREEKMKVCKLDDAISEKVTFIKMDIEGAEMKALKGAERIIKEDKPKLAICAYHLNCEHTWEIPLYLKSIVPEYKFYLRHHRGDYAETVLYATTNPDDIRK